MNEPTDPVFEAQKAILADVTDRRGWCQEWEHFDAAVKREVKKTWRRLLVPIFERVRRDARNEALEEAAKEVEKTGWGNTPDEVRVLTSAAAALRAMKETP